MLNRYTDQSAVFTPRLVQESKNKGVSQLCSFYIARHHTEALY